MRKAFVALIFALVACDAGVNCGGCAPPRSSVVGRRVDAGVNLTSAPIESAPRPAASRAVAAPTVFIAPPARPAAPTSVPSATPTTTGRAATDPTPIDAAQPTPSPRVEMEAASPVEDGDIPAGVDASTVILGSGEAPDGASEDAALD